MRRDARLRFQKALLVFVMVPSLSGIAFASASQADSSLSLVASENQTTLTSLGGNLEVSLTAQGAKTCEIRSIAWEAAAFHRLLPCASQLVATIPVPSNPKNIPFRAELEISATSGSRKESRNLAVEVGASPVGSSTGGTQVASTDIFQSATTSGNWSGYALIGGRQTLEHSGMTFGGITAEWRIPVIECAATPNSSSAEWLGVDGTSSTDPGLFQSGTVQVCNKGQLLADFAWWTSDRVGLLPQLLFPASPGDLIRAEIEQGSPGIWDYFIEDLTSGQVSEGPEPYNGAGASAEWVVENPGRSTLANFQSVTFSQIGLVTSTGSWSDPPTNTALDISGGTDSYQTATSTFNGIGTSASFSVRYSPGVEVTGNPKTRQHL